MINYLLQISCGNEECPSFGTKSTFWYVNSTTAHPCGICGETKTVCEAIDQKEVPDLPLPSF